MISRNQLAAVLLGGLAATAMAACSDAGGNAWAGTITDSAGIQLVQNPATGTWGPDEGWHLTHELTIGTAEGEAEYQFGRILPANSLAVLSNGQIVVFDAQGQHLKVYGPDGTYVRTIAGPGNGPGEIGPADQSSLLLLPGDTLQVNDFGNQRISFFLPDGTYVRSYPLNLQQGLPFGWAMLADGRPVAQMRQIAFPGGPALTDSMDALVVRNTDGTLGDTLMRLPSGRTFQFRDGAPEWNFFVPEPVWTLHQGRVLFGINDNYRIGFYNEGALERVVTKPFTPAPISDSDIATMRDAFADLLRDQGAPPQAVTVLTRDRLHFHDTYPAFAQILEGPNGTLLTQLFQPVSTLSPEEQESFNFLNGSLGSRNWDVFDSTGRYLGVVEMPLRFQPVRFVGNTVYGIQRDDLDVQYVVRLRIDLGEER